VLPGGGLDGIAHRIAAAGGVSRLDSPRRPDRSGGERAVRILICEDSALLREGSCACSTTPVTRSSRRCPTPAR
jgi:hypothetical protein